jgi:ribosomal protein S18 acetylase RimI-like enzyme
MSDLRIIEATTTQHIEAARELFQEYAASLDFELCFQNFEAELTDLPGAYAPPRGCLLLALKGESVAGCVALRPLAPGICEMKRLYVREAWRGHGVGLALCKAIVQRGQALGYNSMCLDTVATMQSAISLYEGLGFREIEAYYPNPLKDVRYFELVW